MTDDEQFGALLGQCTEALLRVARLTRPHDSELLALDMGMGQFKAMLVLTKHRQLTVGGLAKVLDISEPSASLMVDKLEARGLAARKSDAADRRRTLVVPTEEGDGLMDRLRHTQDIRLTGWLGAMEAADLRALLQGLVALAEAIERGKGCVEGRT